MDETSRIWKFCHVPLADKLNVTNMKSPFGGGGICKNDYWFQFIPRPSGRGGTIIPEGLAEEKVI